MTSNPPASPGGQAPGAPAAAICKRPGCGNILPAGDRGRARQFCGDSCARRYHNDARVPVPAAAPADSPADPLAALDTVIRQAAVLTRAAREQAAAWTRPGSGPRSPRPRPHGAAPRQPP